MVDRTNKVYGTNEGLLEIERENAAAAAGLPSFMSRWVLGTTPHEMSLSAAELADVLLDAASFRTAPRQGTAACTDDERADNPPIQKCRVIELDEYRTRRAVPRQRAPRTKGGIRTLRSPTWRNPSAVPPGSARSSNLP
jgi:hypothetical protein